MTSELIQILRYPSFLTDYQEKLKQKLKTL